MPRYNCRFRLHSAVGLAKSFYTWGPFITSFQRFWMPSRCSSDSLPGKKSTVLNTDTGAGTFSEPNSPNSEYSYSAPVMCKLSGYRPLIYSLSPLYIVNGKPSWIWSFTNRIFNENTAYLRIAEYLLWTYLSVSKE